MGVLTYRIYRTLQKGDNVVNTFIKSRERIGRIVEMHADSREVIGISSGRRYSCTAWNEKGKNGHTLADANNPATLEPMVFPDPVISIAISPKDKAGTESWEKFTVKLSKKILHFK